MMESRKQEISIFKGTVSSVIGLKLEGSSQVPFLLTKIVQAFFHSRGILHDLQIVRKSLVITVLRNGHLLEHITEIWSNGQGQPEDFILYIIFMTQY